MFKPMGTALEFSWLNILFPCLNSEFCFPNKGRIVVGYFIFKNKYSLYISKIISMKIISYM